MNYLLEFCKTDRQREVLNAVIEHGGQRQAARALNCHRRTVDKVINVLRKRAESKGVAPEKDLYYPQPELLAITGTSTLQRSPSGNLQWIKTSRDEAQRVALMLETLESLKEELPRYSPIHCEGGHNADLMNVYTITDFHLGAYAWHEETGADWNIDVAENLLINWFATAIAHAPLAEHAVFAQMGDFLHWDGIEAVTPAHRHILDADTRFQKLVRVAIRVIRKVINMLLKKHQRVTILMCDANHDPASGAWLREWLPVVYENEPRVTVDTSADTYYCVEHGLTSLFFHHGHKRKVAEVDRVFAGKYREVFGRTKHSYAHLGHLHSNELKETQLMQVEMHRTLAAPDAYASKGGWLSGRDAKVITYHKQYGEVGRIIVNPDMVRDEIGRVNVE